RTRRSGSSRSATPRAPSSTSPPRSRRGSGGRGSGARSGGGSDEGRPGSEAPPHPPLRGRPRAPSPPPPGPPRPDPPRPAPAGARVRRGVGSFGASSVVHRARLLELSEDLPIVVEIVDAEEKVRVFLERVDPILEEAGCGVLMTLEKVEILRYASKKG